MTPLPGRTGCAALAAAGCLLALGAVYVGTGFQDGFANPGLAGLGRRLLGALPWALPLSAVGGLALHAFYARLLDPGPRGAGGVIAIAVGRAFAHFPLFGMLALLAMMWFFVAAFGHGLRVRWLGRHVRSGGRTLEHWIGPPLWFITLPFVMLRLQREGDLKIPHSIPRRRLLRWLPAVLALLLFYPGAVSEDSGERIDPYGLAVAASFWLADWLIVSILVAPRLRADDA